MAHRLARSGGSGSDDSSRTTPGDGRTPRALTRRGWLAAAGAALASLLLGGAASSAAAGDDGTTVHWTDFSEARL